MNEFNILIVIPARGGSKGIPRKNLRLLNGKPLIYYSINNAKNIDDKIDVYVTTEDQEIETISRKFGAKIHKREIALSDDKSTLDPVIYSALIYAEEKEGKRYDIVITMQATSPLLETHSLKTSIENLIESNEIDTIISAQDDTHLTWSKENNVFVPNYTERLNRQYLKPGYKETGGFLITRRDTISQTNRIGKNVSLHLLSNGEEIDIDTFNDWNLCEYILKKKKVLIVVSGNETIGLGHVYNTLIIANDILNHDVEFLVTKDSSLALKKIQAKNYKVQIQESEELIDDIVKLKPDVVINDILDTKQEYIIKLLDAKLKTINFEDLGKGARYANLVINAIYPETEQLKNHYFGEKYFVLRDEFIFNYSEKIITPNVKEILITFGGVDPCNLTELVIRSIHDYCSTNNIKINIVTGFGYDKFDSLESYKNIAIHENVQNISDFMFNADLIFTSAGRTVYEIASIGTPAIVIAQNERELTHFYASEEFGFINLGLGYKTNEKEILNCFVELSEAFDLRKNNHYIMMQQNLKLGRKRVQNLINNLIES